MLEIKNLNKTFKSKKGDKVTALHNVSFSLPDKGLVCIVGQSGCGKTTLLSLIGGLDSVTSGEIIFNNKDITKLKHHELDDYRNFITGFIFQDYHLIESLTIFENIKISLNLQNIKNDKLIYDALDKVGLKGYESRYPSELSGGQQQRISIARTIVKNPQIILADEPTGNLDLNTSRSIFKILKEIAKDKLIIIVTHDLYGAKENADYLIHLNEGVVINSYIKDINKNPIDSNTLYLPLHKNLSDEELKLIYQKIKTKDITNIIQYNEIFIPYEINNKSSHEYKINNKKQLNIKNNLFYGNNLFKGKRFKSTLFSFFIAIILSILGFALLVTNINTYDQSAFNTIASLENIIVEKNLDNFSYDSKEYKDILNENYIDTYKKHGYSGKIYQAYSIGPLFFVPTNYFLDIQKFQLNNLVITEPSYLANVFGDDTLQFIVKKDEEELGGVYVCDFLIDRYFKLYGKNKNIENYNKILNNGFKCNTVSFAVNGIINTHYNEKYPEISKYYNDNKIIDTSIQSKIKECKDSYSFYEKLIYYYSCLFSFDQNAYAAFYNNNKTRVGLLKNSIISHNQNNNGVNLIIKNDSLKDDQIIISYDTYASITGIRLQKKTYIDEPFDVKFNTYQYNDAKLTNSLKEFSLKVIGVDLNTNVNSNIFNQLINSYNQPTALYFSDSSQIKSVYNANKELNYQFSSYMNYQISLSNKYINTLNILFNLFAICLFIVAILMIFYYNNDIINANIKEVGIMKALGFRDKHIFNMLSINFNETLIKMLLFYNIFQRIVVNVCNNILFTNIINISNGTILKTQYIKYILLNSNFLLFMNCSIIIFTLLSFIISFIKIRLLKPTNIIKAKE